MDKFVKILFLTVFSLYFLSGMIQAEEAFPDYYEGIYNKVTFDCYIEFHDEIKEKTLYQSLVKNCISAKDDTAMKMFGDNKEILNEYTDTFDNGIIQKGCYFDDASAFFLSDNTFSYTSCNFKYYSQIGVNNFTVFQEPEGNQKSTVKAKECIGRIESVLEQIGFPSEKFEFFSYSTDAETMRQIEKSYVSEGIISPDQCKPEWMEEDDVCVVYAYQKEQGIPVYTELMSMSSSLAEDIVYNAPVQAICTGKSIESLLVMYIYDFAQNDQQIELMNFKDIAAVVENKYNNLLDETNYTVNAAKLFQMVRHNQKQEYETVPIWYFEISKDTGEKVFTIINAESGKEIYIS